MSYLCYMCVFVDSGVKQALTIWAKCGCLTRDKNCLPFASTWVHSDFWWGPCCSSFSAMCHVCPMLPLSLDCLFFFFCKFTFFFLQTTHSSHHMHRTRQTYYKCKWQLMLFVCSAHNHFFSEINCNCNYHPIPNKPLFINKYIN